MLLCGILSHCKANSSIGTNVGILQGTRKLLHLEIKTVKNQGEHDINKERTLYTVMNCVSKQMRIKMRYYPSSHGGKILKLGVSLNSHIAHGE